MKYSSIKLDENHKAVICPRCENEERNHGNYSKICGGYLVNKCYGNGNVDIDGDCINNGCGEPADGNARYRHGDNHR